MKYLISKKIRIGDLNSFVENHEGLFVGEPSLERIAAVAEEEKVWKLVDGFGLKPASSVLSADSIRDILIADIDAVVCYEKDTNEYGKFGKKIITIDLL